MKKYLFNNQWVTFDELHSLSKSLTQPSSLSIWSSYAIKNFGLSVSANEEDQFTETMYAIPSENIGYSTLNYIHTLGMSISKQFNVLIASNSDNTDTSNISMVAFTDEFESVVFRTDSDTHFKTYNELAVLGYHPVLPEITKVTDYLYEATYTEFDYDKAYAFANYYLEKYNNQFGSAACTGVQFGNFRGRNFDWYYDNNAEFIVKVSAIANARHASIGISALTRGLTKDFVESGEFSASYYILPFYMTDGINDAGLCVSINIVTVDDKYQHESPSLGTHTGILDGRYSDDQVTQTRYTLEETGRTTGTNPSAPITIPAMFVPRYLLDHAGTIEEAIKIMTEDLNIVRVASKSDPSNAQEIHFLITAKDSSGNDKTIVVETINNTLIVVTYDRKEYYDLDTQSLVYYSGNGYNQGYVGNLISKADLLDYHPCIMTNHYLATPHLTLYGAGMERDTIVVNGLHDLISRKQLSDMTYEDMQLIMESVFYTKAYTDLDSDNPWLSEFHHDYSPAVYGDLNILSAKSDFDTLIPVLKTMYQNRDRDTANTWHTVHSCVYDLAQKMMYVKVQESSNVYYLSLDDLEIREIKSDQTFYLSSSKSVLSIDFMRTVSSSSSTKNEEWLLRNIDVGFNIKDIARVYYLYDDSGNKIIYDNTKKYTVVSINSETSRLTPSGYSESLGIAYIMTSGNLAYAYSIDTYDGYAVLKPYYVGYFGYADPQILNCVSLSISIKNIES